MPNELEITITRFQPPEPEVWSRATEAQKKAWYALVGQKAEETLKARLLEGRDKYGHKLLRRLRPRSDHANGPPLSPHRDTSRSIRLIDSRATPSSCTIFWREGWGEILKYHKDGIPSRRGKRIRDVGGFTSKERIEIYNLALKEWKPPTLEKPKPLPPSAPAPKPRIVATERLKPQPAPPKPAPVAEAAVAPPTPPPPKTADDVEFSRDYLSENRKDVLLRVEMRRLDALLSVDQNYYVGAGGTGPSARPSSYTNALGDVAKAIGGGRGLWAPRIALSVEGGLTVADGRHRLAALRDSGANYVTIAVRKNESKKIGILLGVPQPPTVPTRVRVVTIEPGESPLKFGSFFGGKRA